MNNELFRKVALDKLSSPEQLDQTMRVAGPLYWTSLLAILVALTAAGVWSLTGSIPTKSIGEGTIIDVYKRQVLEECADLTGDRLIGGRGFDGSAVGVTDDQDQLDAHRGGRIFEAGDGVRRSDVAGHLSLIHI